MFSKDFFEDKSVYFHCKTLEEMFWIYAEAGSVGVDVYGPYESDWPEWTTFGYTGDEFCGIRNIAIEDRKCVEVSDLMDSSEEPISVNVQEVMDLL